MPRQSGKSGWKKSNLKRAEARRKLREEAVSKCKIRIKGKTSASQLEKKALRLHKLAQQQEKNEVLEDLDEPKQDDQGQIPADRREFYMAWKRRTGHVINILEEMHSHVLREFFRIEQMEEDRHQAEESLRENEVSNSILVEAPPILAEDPSAEFR